MPEDAVYIGWDVGGWEGSRDALAAVVWGGHGAIELAGAPARVCLRDVLVSGRCSVDDLLAQCGAKCSWSRAVIGIDAPLGWPDEFARHVATPLSRAPTYWPREPGEIGNRLAYRCCDRVVHERCGKKPMSAVFDRLGNNATKALTACRMLAAAHKALVSPQQGLTGRVILIEAYPALWKQGAAKAGKPVDAAAAALSECAMPAAGSDELDALLAALSAACYDNQVRELGLGLPALHMPDDVQPDGAGKVIPRETICREGWIYFPRSALTDRQ